MKLFKIELSDVDWEEKMFDLFLIIFLFCFCRIFNWIWCRS